MKRFLHLKGQSVDLEYNGKTLHVSLVQNSSHLEAVNPVALGKVGTKNIFFSLQAKFFFFAGESFTNRLWRSESNSLCFNSWRRRILWPSTKFFFLLVNGSNTNFFPLKIGCHL